METNHIWLSCAHYVAIYLSVFDRRILGHRFCVLASIAYLSMVFLKW